MKNLLFIILLAGVTKSFSQQDTAISYTSSVNVTGLSKEELYIRARDWFSNNLQSLQLQDKKTGELSGKGIVEGVVKFRMSGSHNANAIFNFNTNIWLKDRPSMYRITNISNTSITYGNSTSLARDDLSSPGGILCTSEHSKARVPGLSKTKSDETNQSAKNTFDDLAKGLIASLRSGMEKQSTPDF
ncbi:MAG: DUF4468 domain-containing protein [Ginsengibacter sp.]